jgi:hypothetical protein
MASVVFTGPVHRTEQKKVDRIGPEKTGPEVYLWTSLLQSSCWSFIYKNIVGPMKNWFQPVFHPNACGTLLPHIYTSFSVSGSSKMFKNWLRYDQKDLCTSILLYLNNFDCIAYYLSYHFFFVQLYDMINITKTHLTICTM